MKILRLCCFVFAIPLLAQQSPGDDPIGRLLFPPELVLSHQDEVGLVEKQRAQVKSEVMKVQTRFIEMQWQLGEESGKMATLLRAVPVDEAKVLEQADRVMAMERDIKRMHLTMLIRIRNLLTNEQRAKLEEIRRRGL